MKVKVFTTDSADEAETARLNMEASSYEVLVANKAEMVTINCQNLENGSEAAGLNSWVVIGKKG